MDSRKILHSHSYRIWSYWFWHESVSLMKVLLVLKMVHMRTTTKPRCCHRRFDCILIINFLVHGLAHVHLLSIYPPTYFVNPTSKVRSANMREIWPNVVLRTPNVYNQLYMTYMYLKHFTYVSSLRRHRRQTRHKILNFARLQIAHTNDVTLQCTASWFRVSATQIRWVLKIQLQITPFSNCWNLLSLLVGVQLMLSVRRTGNGRPHRLFGVDISRGVFGHEAVGAIGFGLWLVATRTVWVAAFFCCGNQRIIRFWLCAR